MTIDGFIAQTGDQVSTAWTSIEDKKWFSQRTKQAGVVLFGRKTYQTFNRPLPNRLNLLYTTSQPEQLASSEQQDLTTSHQPLATALPPRQLIGKLTDLGYTELAICGGALVYTQFLQAGVVDRLYLTVEPVVYGTGVKLFNEQLSLKLRLVESKNLSDQTILLTYDVVSA